MLRSPGFASLIALASLTACPSSDPKVEFAALAVDERDVVIRAAVGGLVDDALEALLLAIQSSGDQPDCPRVEPVGKKVIVDAGAGCDSAVGIRFAGRVELENLEGFTDFDRAQVSRMVFVDFRRDEQRFDGEISRLLVGDREDYEMTVDFEADVGPVIAVDLSADCTEDGCTTRPGARGELVGVGVFDIEEVQVVDEGTGESRSVVELRGEDTVRYDETHRGDDGCTPYTIDGEAAGQVCR